MRHFISATLLAGLALNLAGPTYAQDAEAGKKVFKKCKACHVAEEGAKSKVGPNLYGVVGRTAGSLEGYKYGKSIIATGEKGLIWDEEKIAEYVLDPKKYLSTYLEDDSAKAKMSFKLKKEQQRKDVAAYLATLTNQTEAD